jgi:hypothetical protein
MAILSPSPGTRAATTSLSSIPTVLGGTSVLLIVDLRLMHQALAPLK